MRRTLGTMMLVIPTHTHCRKSSVPSCRGCPQNEMLLYRDAFTHRSFYTQTLLHTDTFTRRSFYTQMLLHRHFYTQTLLHAQKLLHTDTLTHTLSHTDTFTHRRFYTRTLFTHRGFYTQKLSHTEAFTHRSFYTQTLSHTETGPAKSQFYLNFTSGQKTMVRNSERIAQLPSLNRSWQRWEIASKPSPQTSSLLGIGCWCWFLAQCLPSCDTCGISKRRANAIDWNWTQACRSSPSTHWRGFGPRVRSPTVRVSDRRVELDCYSNPFQSQTSTIRLKKLGQTWANYEWLHYLISKIICRILTRLPCRPNLDHTVILLERLERSLKFQWNMSSTFFNIFHLALWLDESAVSRNLHENQAFAWLIMWWPNLSCPSLSKVRHANVPTLCPVSSGFIHMTPDFFWNWTGLTASNSARASFKSYQQFLSRFHYCGGMWGFDNVFN